MRYYPAMTTTTSRIRHRPAPPLVWLSNSVYRLWLAKTAKTFHGRAFCFAWNKTVSKQFSKLLVSV